MRRSSNVHMLLLLRKVKASTARSMILPYPDCICTHVGVLGDYMCRFQSCQKCSVERVSVPSLIICLLLFLVFVSLVHSLSLSVSASPQPPPLGVATMISVVCVYTEDANAKGHNLGPLPLPGPCVL